MADYVSILRRTLDGLGPAATPTLRERVYGRAREAVQRQLDGMNPPPSDDVVAKQKSDLESAIEEVEAGFAERAAESGASEPTPTTPEGSSTESVAGAEQSSAETSAAPSDQPEGEAVTASPEPRPVPPPEPVPPVPSPSPVPTPTEPPTPEPQLRDGGDVQDVTPVVADREQHSADQSALSSDATVSGETAARSEFGAGTDADRTLEETVTTATQTGARESVSETGAGYLPDENLPDRPLIGPGGDPVLDPSAATSIGSAPMSSDDGAATDRVSASAGPGDTSVAGPPAGSGLDPSLFDDPGYEPGDRVAISQDTVGGREPAASLLASNVEDRPSEAMLDPAPIADPGMQAELNPVSPQGVDPSDRLAGPAAVAGGTIAAGAAAGRTDTAGVGTLPRASVPPTLADGAGAGTTGSLGSISSLDSLRGEGEADASGTGTEAATTAPVAKPLSGSPTPPPAPQKRRGGMVAASLLVLLLVIGAGYAARDSIADATGVEEFRTAFGIEDTVDRVLARGNVADEPAVAVNDTDTGDGDATVDVPAPPAAEPATEPSGTVVADGPEKFTERLGADGEEVDTDPQPTDVVTTPVEPTNVPSETQDDGSTEVARLDPPTTDNNAAAESGDARAFLTREPVGGTTPEQGTGDVAWSIVQESPGGDLPPEPAIRGEVALSDGTALSLTVKRNADQGLPASHLIEIIFLPPEGGPRIDELPLVGFKDSLQVNARPLIAVPAKITDEFFLVGLNNLATAVQSNLELMGSEEFMDVQLIFSGGRRATLTLEKGSTGDEVFAEVLSAWENAPSPG